MKIRDNSHFNPGQANVSADAAASIPGEGMIFSISAWKDGVYLGLEKMLLIFKDTCAHMSWYVDVFELAPQPGAMAFIDSADKKFVGYSDLLGLAAQNLQIIDGEVFAKDSGSGSYLRFRAVDSSFWDIETNIPEAIALVRQAFPEAQELPSDYVYPDPISRAKNQGF